MNAYQYIEAGTQPESEQPQEYQEPEFETQEQKLKVGFAAMSARLQREIARMGGIERGRQLHEAAKRRREEDQMQ